METVKDNLAIGDITTSELEFSLVEKSDLEKIKQRKLIGVPSRFFFSYSVYVGELILRINAPPR